MRVLLRTMSYDLFYVFQIDFCYLALLSAQPQKWDDNADDAEDGSRILSQIETFADLLFVCSWLPFQFRISLCRTLCKISRWNKKSIETSIDVARIRKFYSSMQRTKNSFMQNIKVVFVYMKYCRYIVLLAQSIYTAQ